MLQVELIILVEDGIAKDLQGITNLESLIKISFDLVPLLHTRLSRLFCQCALLQSLSDRIVHDLDQSVSKRLESLGTRRKGGVSTILIVPLIQISLHQLVNFLLLFLLELFLEFVLFL